MGLFNGNGKEHKTTKAIAKLELWSQEHTAMDTATAELRAKMVSLQTQLDIVSAPHLERIETLEDQIKQLVGEIGASVKGEGAKAQYRKSYPRVSWNSERLIGYAEDHPGILKFRKETTVKSNVSIKLT